MSLRLFSTPLLICANGTSQLTLFRNSAFSVRRLPIFLPVKRASILSSTVVVVADSRSAFFWDLKTEKCSLCCPLTGDILDIYTNQHTLIFTTSGIIFVPSEGKPTVISSDLPSQSFVRCSPDLTVAAVVSKESFLWISITERRSTQFRTVSLPAPCHDLAVSHNCVIGLFDSGRGAVRNVCKWNQREWEKPIDVPPVTLLFGCPEFWFAASNHYVLVLHEKSPDDKDDNQTFFSFFASGVPPIRDLLSNIPHEREAELGRVLLLFYGLETVVEVCCELSDRFMQLVSVILDELWRRQLFERWCEVALLCPGLLRTRQCSQCIAELLKSGDLGLTLLVPFAAILKAIGNANEAFRLYLKARNGSGVAELLPIAVESIDGYLLEIVELLQSLIQSGDSHNAESIVKCLSDHPRAVRPQTVVAALVFNWPLLNLYYSAFKEPPPIVVNAYVNALAIYERGKLQGFLDSHEDYDWEIVSESLLKLGCLPEFGSILRRFDVKRYFEYLVLREDWKTLFTVLLDHKDHSAMVMRMMAFDEGYFLEFAKHFEELGLSLSDIVGEIPKECPPKLLVNAFQYITHVLSVTNMAEQLAESICLNEAVEMFEDVTLTRNKPIVVNIV